MLLNIIIIIIINVIILNNTTQSRTIIPITVNYILHYIFSANQMF